MSDIDWKELKEQEGRWEREHKKSDFMKMLETQGSKLKKV